MAEFNHLLFLFFSISAIFRGEKGVKVGLNVKIWICPVAAKFLIFQKFLKQCLFLVKCYLWCKFQQNPTLFGGVRVPKPPISWMLLSPWNYFKIYNLRTTNAMKMKLGSIVYLHETFHLTKDLRVAQRVS